LLETSKTRSSSSVPIPYKDVFLACFFEWNNLSKPTSLPVGVDTPLGEVPTTVLLLPPNEPELTTTGLSDKTKAPIILELLEVEVIVF
jgi:hypothetical protein